MSTPPPESRTRTSRLLAALGELVSGIVRGGGLCLALSFVFVIGLSVMQPPDDDSFLLGITGMIAMALSLGAGVLIGLVRAVREWMRG